MNIHSDTSVAAFNGQWHHICLSWESSLGSWKFYKNGALKAQGSNLKKGYTIRQGGTVVLGQDQDSVGGRFDSAQSFQGMLSNVNLWNQALADSQIELMSKSCLSDEASDRKVYKWLDFLREGGATLVKPSPCEMFGVGKWQL